MSTLEVNPMKELFNIEEETIFLFLHIKVQSGIRVTERIKIFIAVMSDVIQEHESIK